MISKRITADMSIRNHDWSLMSPNITSEFRTERRKQ